MNIIDNIAMVNFINLFPNMEYNIYNNSNNGGIVGVYIKSIESYILLYKNAVIRSIKHKLPGLTTKPIILEYISLKLEEENNKENVFLMNIPNHYNSTIQKIIDNIKLNNYSNVILNNITINCTIMEKRNLKIYFTPEEITFYEKIKMFDGNPMINRFIVDSFKKSDSIMMSELHNIPLDNSKEMLIFIYKMMY